MLLKKMSTLLSLVVLATMLLAACAPATTPAAPQPTVAPQIVEVTKIVAGTPVVVTATPAPTNAPTATNSPYDDKAPIKVWVDAERAKQVQAFIKKFPEKGKLIEIVNDQLGALVQQKLQLYNNVGGGWPDVIFEDPSTWHTVNTVAYNFFPADLSPWIQKDTLDKFYPGANEACKTTDGKLICLRNDIAPNMMYYNVPLFKEFGYEPPKTWEEYLTLAEKVAKEHPGYTLGELDGWEPALMWYRVSECPLLEPLSPSKFRVNFLHPNCTRMSEMLDKVNALGVLDKQGIWSADYAKVWKANKWLIHFSPSWFPDFVIKGTYLDPADAKFLGTVGIAPIPNWAEQKKHVTSNVGGGSYAMSSHTKNPKLAAELIVFCSTDPEVGKAQAATPAYQPSAQQWGAALLTRVPLLAANPDPWKVIDQSAGEMWGGIAAQDSAVEGPPKSSPIVSPLFGQAVTDKKPIVGIAAEVQKQLVEMVQKSGFEVETTGP